ncbi:hypothetical protein [Pannonibacter phragmitetus]|uniref:hypothetical protein n=1 Tax=Pannonibacter phragmitetus TaxID=121719 RepID=UPI003D2EA7E9
MSEEFLTLPARLAAEAVLSEKAATDPSFRKMLTADPAEAISSTFGDAPDAGVSFRVIEEGPEEIVFVLPPLPDELSDKELATASGGLTLNISIDPNDLATTTPGGSYNITLIKSRAGTAAPVWAFADPFKANQINWQEGYTLYGAK